MNAAAANVIPFHSPALTRAVLKWRAQAWWILGDPASPEHRRHLALRFLQTHGLI